MQKFKNKTIRTGVPEPSRNITGCYDYCGYYHTRFTVG